MPDAIPVPREEIERFMRERAKPYDEDRDEPGYRRVPRGASGIFDEHGNYLVNPLRGNPRSRALAQKAGGARRLDEYRRLIAERRTAEAIAELLQVTPGHVRNVARRLGATLAGEPPASRTTRKPVVDNRQKPAAPQRPPVERAPRRWEPAPKVIEAPASTVARAPAQAPAGRPATDSEIRDAYRACHAARMSNAGIAQTMGVSLSHVRRMLWLLGLEPNPTVLSGGGGDHWKRG